MQACAIFLSAAAVVAATLVRALSAPANGDCAWFVYAAGRILDGARMYRDIIDMNLPLAFAIPMPAALAARWTGLPDTAAYIIFTLVAALAACALCARILRDLLPDTRAVVLYAFLIIALPLAGIDLGQREHLVFLAATPYLLIAAARMLSVPIPVILAVAAGLFAGVALAIKPFYLLLFAGTAVYGSWRRGRLAGLRDPEAVSILTISAAHAAFVIWRTPEYFEVAAYTAASYGGYNLSWPALLLHPWTLLTLACAAVAWRGGTVPKVLAIGALAACAGALLQQKGYGYHFAAARSLALLALALCFATPLSRLRYGGVVLVLAPALVLASAAGAKRHSPLLPVVQEHASGGSILVLSSHCWSSFPLVNEARVRWTMPYNCLWALPGAYSDQRGTRATYHLPGAMRPGEREFFAAVTGGFAASRPTLLVVDQGADKFGLEGLGFDFLEYFRQDERFRATLRNYSSLGRVGRYEVWKRGG